MTSSKPGYANTPTTRIQKQSKGRRSQRPLNKYEIPSNPIRCAREYSVVKTACLASYSGSLPLMSETLPRGLKHRQPTQVSAFRASETDKSIITMPPEATTGGHWGDSAEALSAPGTVIPA